MAAIKGSSKPHDTYSIHGGSHWGWAHNFTDAKKIGERIAKAGAYKGKWNLLFIAVTIHKGGPVFYGRSLLNMYVPVRGSGKRLDYIIAEIKRRHGVAPFVWTKK